MMKTERLILRKWKETDAESLFAYASDPDVGPIAGWSPHRSIEESLNVIRNVFDGAECYAICEKENGKAIGAIELKLNGHTDMTERDDACELGYWLGKPFWGRGYVPEAAREIIRHGFEDLGMNTIWCGYYEGNQKSKRVQEKLGFVYHHTCNDVPVPLLNEVRVGHTNIMTRAHWEEIRARSEKRKFVEECNIKNSALVVIDLQNDITKNYREIIEKVNAAIDWAVQKGLHIVYIQHNNLSDGTRTFKPGTRGAEFVPELKVVSDHIFTKTKSNALTSGAFAAFIRENGIDGFYIVGADAAACIKSTCFNMAKAGYAVQVLSDCITSYDKKKLPELLAYYESKGCSVIPLQEVMEK